MVVAVRKALITCQNKKKGLKWLHLAVANGGYFDELDVDYILLTNSINSFYIVPFFNFWVHLDIILHNLKWL